MDEKIVKIKKWLKVSFTLSFTSSKLLAYIVVGLGTYVSLQLKSETPFTVSVLAATALFGVKMFTDNKTNKSVDEAIESAESKL